MTSLPAPRSKRSQIAAMTYDGPQSVTDAVALRQQMAATVDLAKRAHIDAREHLWNAREAERTLGRMILAARKAGDLADEGRPEHGETVETLHSLGIDRHMAAHAVNLAGVPDEVWQAWHDWDAEPTQGTVARGVREYQSKVDDVKAHAADARAAAKRLRERKAEIERELAELAERAKAATGPDAPPLRDDETATFTGDMVVSATAADETDDTDDRDRVNGDRWLTLMRRIEQLITAIEQPPPPLPNDHFADLTVLSARDLARRATTNTAAWIRAVNDEYAERIKR